MHEKVTSSTIKNRKRAMMETWKLPPKPKIYEAMSAVVDGRVRMTGEHSAEVVSSTGTKIYTVKWEGGGDCITSNDNASHWQGYTGYPIIAVLMTLGRLPCDADAAARLAGIPWKEINRNFRNDYEKAVAHVMSSLEEKGVNVKHIEEEASRIMAQMKTLPLTRLSKRKKRVLEFTESFHVF